MSVDHVIEAMTDPWAGAKILRPNNSPDLEDSVRRVYVSLMQQSTGYINPRLYTRLMPPLWRANLAGGQ